MTEKTIWQKLADPFPPAAISWRVGSTTKDKTKGMALAYIDARDVMRRLDEAVGPANWSDSYIETPKGRIICAIAILHQDGSWVSKSDAAGDTDVEGDKGAISDAFKRAAVKWGIGRYLYDLDSPWVELTAAGNSFKIKDSEYARLEKLLGGKFKVAPEPPAPAAAPAPAPVEPAFIPVPLNGQDLNWKAWAGTYLAGIRAMPTPEALAELQKLNAAPWSNFRTANPAGAEYLAKEIAARFSVNTTA
jgi:hypothetical protein